MNNVSGDGSHLGARIRATDHGAVIDVCCPVSMLYYTAAVRENRSLCVHVGFCINLSIWLLNLCHMSLPHRLPSIKMRFSVFAVNTLWRYSWTTLNVWLKWSRDGGEKYLCVQTDYPAVAVYILKRTHTKYLSIAKKMRFLLPGYVNWKLILLI